MDPFTLDDVVIGGREALYGVFCDKLPSVKPRFLKLQKAERGAGVRRYERFVTNEPERTSTFGTLWHTGGSRTK